MNQSYMELAISLAKGGIGHVNPNPLVGAVITKNDQIIGKGLHRQYGGLHAERDAFSHLTEDCNGGELYVTLEPCCHYGKQPPCTQAIIEHGIKRVYVGSLDPNPLVSGKGIKELRMHGIEVTEGVMKTECDALNPVFFHYIKNKQPLIALKYAMTLDGKTAAKTGLSRWITGEAARAHAHTLRNYYTAIMVGIGTVLTDNPLLNCRMEHGRNPIRIICDSHLRIPTDCQIIKTAKQIPTIIAITEQALENPAQQKKIAALKEQSIRILPVPEKEGQLDLKALVNLLGKLSIDGILLEGGGMLTESFLRENLIQHIYVYLAPKLFGGDANFTPVRGIGIETPDDAWICRFQNMTPLGEDLLLEYHVLQKESR